jgi:hypothetical protein
VYVVSPLTMVNSYKTNNDYYRVSAIQRISAGTKSAAKQPASTPFLQSAYQQSAQKETSSLARLLKSANNAEPLFQLEGSSLKPYGQYRSQLQAYLPVPMTGLLLDRMM